MKNHSGTCRASPRLTAPEAASILVSGYEDMNLAQHVDTLNVLGDENRIRLCMLLRERELCVELLPRGKGHAQ